MNRRVGRLSLELLVRIAARTGLHLRLQSARDRSGDPLAAASQYPPPRRSAVIEASKGAVRNQASGLTPGERAEAFLEHNEWLAELKAAGASRASPR
jgi:hypothetical protein